MLYNNVMDKKTKRQIRRLKRRLRREYKTYLNIEEQYSCGARLARYVGTPLTVQAGRIYAIHTELLKIDPECPKTLIL